MANRANVEMCILGAGVTGLAAARASGHPVFEAVDTAGGICSSYYMRPGEARRLSEAPQGGDAYRFEIGGGHWIFGGDPVVLRLIQSLLPVKRYVRRSSVFLSDQDIMVPYPLQNNLRFLDASAAARALQEIIEGSVRPVSTETMTAWLQQHFGKTLCDLFFEPFHSMYTAGLSEHIAPQDAYKTPVDLSKVVRGAFEGTDGVGYNSRFVYPPDGLDRLVSELARGARITYGKKVHRIHPEAKTIAFADGTEVHYSSMISTLPLNRMMEMTGLDAGTSPDPSTSVLVVNIGAIRGAKCPSDHWIYVPGSRAGFHRVGFYSNVDESFLPERGRSERTSIYVEFAYRDGDRPTEEEIARRCQQTVDELTEWGWIERPEIVDPTWIDVAYTWSWPASTWRQKALGTLAEHGIYQTGRYGRWRFQGIADSILEGLAAGAAFAGVRP